MKKCNRCDKEKKYHYFSPDKRNKDGHQGICKLCQNKIRSEKYKTDINYRNKQKSNQVKYNREANVRAKKHIENLTDFYIIASLKRGTNLSTEDIKKHPELIKAKKQIILNKRLCQKLKTSKN